MICVGSDSGEKGETGWTLGRANFVKRVRPYAIIKKKAYVKKKTGISPAPTERPIAHLLPLIAKLTMKKKTAVMAVRPRSRRMENFGRSISCQNRSKIYEMTNIIRDSEHCTMSWILTDFLL